MSSRVRPQPAGTKSSALCRLFLGFSDTLGDSGPASIAAGAGGLATLSEGGRNVLSGGGGAGLLETIMVKVVEEAEDGAATGDSSTSPEGPKKMGLDTGGAGVGTGGVGSIRGGVNPWWLSKRVGRTTNVGGYWAMGRAILGFKKMGLCSLFKGVSIPDGAAGGEGGIVEEAASVSGGRVASDT